MKTFLWLLPYLISGFSAPLIFRVAPSPHVAGRIAGALFLVAVGWANFLAFKNAFPFFAKIYFMLFALVTVVFYSWRFQIASSLRESILLGVSGSAWHQGLTLMYVVGLILLVFWKVR